MARAGEVDGATQLLARVTAQEPTFPDALEAYGEMLDMAGQSGLATSMYDAHRKLRFGTRQAPPDRPFVLRRIGRFTHEIAAYSLAVRCIGNRAFPYVALGNAYMALRMPRKALANYIVALDCKPDNYSALALKAEALLMMECYQDALATFDLSLKHNPDDADALNGRAIAHLARGLIANAGADWRQQLTLLPLARSSARACVALRLADYALALPELERTLANEPSDPYWDLYRLTSLRRLDRPTGNACYAPCQEWPAPLIALHAGQMTPDEVLYRAGNGERRTEALFQLGILALRRDPAEARCLWQQVVSRSAPTMIEYAAACHELARLDS
jgi:tetratricopeptide (TPR) repeat protein